MFSELVTKINKRGKEQIRELIVTTAAIYNFIQKESDPQRKIPLTSLAGFVASSTSPEVVLQVKSDYDYHLRVEHKHELTQTLVTQAHLVGNTLAPLIRVSQYVLQ